MWFIFTAKEGCPPILMGRFTNKKQLSNLPNLLSIHNYNQTATELALVLNYSAMAKSLCLFPILLSVLIPPVPATPATGTNQDGNETSGLDGFTSNLLFKSYFEKWAENNGAVVSSPFGVGHMLANIHTKVWNVSDDGMEQIFGFPKEDIISHYVDLLEKYDMGQVNTSNFLYVRDENASIELPEAALRLHTELIYTDYINDWNVSWHLMNGLLANNTGGTLDDQLIPISRGLGAAFYEHTVGGYISTTHYKGSWLNTLSATGERNFSDGVSLPFYQVEGKQLVLDDTKFTAAAVQLKDEAKSVVFVLPKGEFDTFFQEDLEIFLQNNMDPSKWQETADSRTVQIPKIKVTTLRNYYRELIELGINNTICLPTEYPDPDSGIKAAGGKENYIALRPFFSTPVVQAGHFQIDGDFIEFASGTATTINSLEKLVNDFASPIEEKEHASLRSEGSLKTLEDGIMNTDAKTTNGMEVDVVVFDRPFFWYLYEKQVGMLYYGSVNSIEKYESATSPPPGSEWLVDIAKVFLWNCK